MFSIIGQLSISRYIYPKCIHIQKHFPKFNHQLFIMHVINTYYSSCLPTFYLSFQLYCYLVNYPPIIIQVCHVSMIYLLEISLLANLLSATLFTYHIFLSHISFIHQLSFRHVTYAAAYSPFGQAHEILVEIAYV